MTGSRNRRSSVNQKIEMLLESSVREQFEMSSQHISGPKAERILARRRLYGIGTGGDLPNVKKWKRENQSAMSASVESITGRQSPPGSPHNLLSSGASMASISTLGTQFPFFGGGASQILDENSQESQYVSMKRRKKQNTYGHEGMYSIITHKTDPEKVFYNSMPSSGGPVNFPPWYVGYQNSTAKPMDIPSVSSRYGNRGAYKMKLRSMSTVPVDCVNEYTPKLNSAPMIPNQPFNSPKLWPESSVYTNGFKGKKPPSSCAYLRETTIDRPATVSSSIIDKRLIHTAKLNDEETVQMRNSIANDRKTQRVDCAQSRAESRKSRRDFLERPRTQQLMRIKSQGIIANKNMKYSGPQLIVMASNKSDASSVIKRENSGGKRIDPISLKWTHITRFVKSLFVTLRTNIVNFDPEPDFLTGVNSLDVILQELKSYARNNKNRILIYRDQFIQALTTKCDGIEDSQANVLFSCFDHHNRNKVHYATVIATAYCIVKPDQSAKDCLKQLWLLFKYHKGDFVAMDNVTEIFTLPCRRQEDLGVVEQELKEVFRPVCYQLVASVKKVPKAVDIDKKETRGEIQKPTTSTFNLCNGILDYGIWCQALERCPSTVQLFEVLRQDQMRSSHSKSSMEKAEVEKAKAVEGVGGIKQRARELASRRVSLAM